MKMLIYLAWALTLDPSQSQDNYIKANVLSAKICELIYGVPVSVQLAQALTESGGGKSYISANSNNHFGIRYYKEEYSGAYFVDRAGAKWRAYDNLFLGYLDHARFISTHYQSVCFSDYNNYSNLAGYGGRKYWSHIVLVIKNKKLYLYDNIHWGRPSV